MRSDDPAAAPLAGLPPDAILVVSTAHSTAEVARHARHAGPVIARGLGDAPGAISTGLAAAAAALLGLPWAALERALREELPPVGVPAQAIEVAVDSARRVWSGVAPAGLDIGHVCPGAGAGEVVDLTWAPAERAAPTVTTEPNTPRRRTGNWRTMRPEITLDRCTRCWVCFVRCPDAAISLDEHDYPRVDYDVCKGCLLWSRSAPRGLSGRSPRCIGGTRRRRDGRSYSYFRYQMTWRPTTRSPSTRRSPRRSRRRSGGATAWSTGTGSMTPKSSW